jgi:excisionase family DNA binding protein
VDRLLSPHEVAQLVPIGYHAVLRAIRSGELRASELRGRYAIRQADFEAWVQSNVVRPSVPPDRHEATTVTFDYLTATRGFRTRAGRTQRSRSER